MASATGDVDVHGMNDAIKVLGCLTMLVVAPLVMAAALVVNGWVVMSLWGWFVCPLGMQPIGYLHAAGISMLFEYMCPTLDKSDLQKVEVENALALVFWQIFGKLVVRPAFVMLIGWLLASYM